MFRKRSTDAPAKPESVEETVAAYDAAARDAAIRWKAEAFDHSPRTIPILETMLGELHGELRKPSLKRRLGLRAKDTEAEQWANLWGVYLGETLRKQLGGEWMMGHEEAPHLLALAFPDGTVAFPTARVFRRILDGAAESVVDYYEMVVREVMSGEGAS